MKSKLTIVKIGGNIIDNETKLKSFLTDFAKLESPKILVHGGGKIATEIANKLGVKSTMIEGRRVTDKASLEVVTMVYAGLINKNLVAKLNLLGEHSLGLSGADLNLIIAKKRPTNPINYGFVGDVTGVNHVKTKELLSLGITPVICALSCDKNGQLLNTNADTIAAEIAKAMGQKMEVSLIYCLDKQGVLLDVDDENSTINELDQEKYQELKTQHVIHDGMIPKLDNCFDALQLHHHTIVLGDENVLRPDAKKTKVTPPNLPEGEGYLAG